MKRIHILNEKQIKKLGIDSKFSSHVFLIFPKDCRDKVRIEGGNGTLHKEISIAEAFSL